MGGAGQVDLQAHEGTALVFPVSHLLIGVIELVLVLSDGLEALVDLALELA